MTYTFNKTVTILGTVYDIEVVKKDDEKLKSNPNAAGFTGWADRKIVLKDLIGAKDEDVDEDDAKALVIFMKKTLRHEIIHAFLSESGLYRNTTAAAHWSCNEEMVDWIAMQGPKIVAAWTEAGAL